MSDNELQERIKKLNQIGIALSSETNLARLLSLVVQEARNFTHADAGSLYIRDGENLRFEVAQNDTMDRRAGGVAQGFQPFPLPLTRTSISGFVALTGTVLNVEDVYELEKDDSVEFSFNRDFDQRNDYRSRSMLVVPMLDHRHENIGVIQLINALDPSGRVIPFSKEVEDLVLSLASQAAVAIRNAQLIDSIKNIFSALVQYSASAIDARSPHTAGHSRRVAALSMMVAEAINKSQDGPYADFSFSEEEMEELNYAAWLHDIGKIGVREHVLEKSGKLSDTHMALIAARFRQIGLTVRNECQRRMLEACKNGDQPDETIAALERECDLRLGEIDEDLAFIQRINTPGFMPDEDVARLVAIAAKTYPVSEGETASYLDDFEYQNLSVRKGNLTTEEYREIQSHVVHTHNIVEKIPFTKELSRIPDFAAAHHEMLNGTGYPGGLTGNDIPVQARILSVVDVFDALVARDRPYKKAMPVDRALAILQDEAKNGRLDPDLVDLFINEGIGSEETVTRLSRQNEDRGSAA